jgi:predicted transcriptional regulator
MSDTTTFGLPGETLGQARRSPMEMVCDVLGVLSDGPTKPTHILYKANMSWKVLAAYLDYLVGKGLVEKEEQGNKRSTYKLTDRGKSILQLYEGLKLSLTGKGTAKEAELLGLLGTSSRVEERQAHPFVW